jgi:hypothetical protein
MRKLLLVATLLLLAAPLSAQRLVIDFPGLEDAADEVVDVTLDAQMLRVAAKFFASGDPDHRAIGDMVRKLDGIYVRSYSFRQDAAYDRSIVAKVRGQLGPNWKRIVNVRSKDRENVEVYTDMRGENIAGLVVISAEPRELTFVNIVGPIDLERLTDLGGQFGIPRVEVEARRRDR